MAKRMQLVLGPVRAAIAQPHCSRRVEEEGWGPQGSECGGIRDWIGAAEQGRHRYMVFVAHDNNKCEDIEKALRT